jgi:hypothetical protein
VMMQLLHWRCCCAAAAAAALPVMLLLAYVFFFFAAKGRSRRSTSVRLQPSCLCSATRGLGGSVWLFFTGTTCRGVGGLGVACRGCGVCGWAGEGGGCKWVCDRVGEEGLQVWEAAHICLCSTTRGLGGNVWLFFTRTTCRCVCVWGGGGGGFGCGGVRVLSL